ncbi:aspartate-semialdehyde dehydrogenase [Pseudoalteromonas fuliginea]|uniref:Aspartate-semialdehyde dehydrogenase n=1 Tax=Pseudoalteromonas fuliginea TaxID=1872678 RepID=A0ABD3Y5H6_9GAMM|nr:aspartate-semialdehyde dehydrogenase [Pseudoalteromonas fuliginea]
MTKSTEIAGLLLDNSKSEDYSGYDPFDSLNSRLLQMTGLDRIPIIRLAWLQFGKRSPINIRRLLIVPKMRNPKGIALFILGLIEDYKRTNNNDFLSDAIGLAEWLLSQQSDPLIWEYSCWGYHFDWEARAFFVPKGKPNIITTVYAARALYKLGEILNRKDFIDASFSSAKFIIEKLYTEFEGKTFFAYIPGEKAFVHNASLWGAAWVAFVASKTKNEYMANTATTVIRESIKAQSSDGSWVYGSRNHHQFIDGFHTGYNLEALCMARKALNTKDFDVSIHLGFIYYKNNFFSDNGIVKYYNNNTYPIDMHSVAQAIFTLLKVGNELSDEELCKKVVVCAIKLLYLEEKKQFSYQINRYYTNDINYTRWTQAWGYFSLAFFNRYFESKYEKN